MDLSVVVPVFNEEKNVGEAIRRIAAFMKAKRVDWEILVSSDGSTDATDRIVAEAAAAEPRVKLLADAPNKGKGNAARRGMLAASGRYVLMTDVDLSSPIKEVDKLVAAIERGHDVAIGSRGLRSPGADVQQSFRRRLSGRIFNFLVKSLVIRDFQDTQCGFKCFTREAARRLFAEQKLDGFAFDVEVLYLARKKGLRVAEVPVMWRQGRDSKVNVFKDSFVMVGDLLKIRKLHAALAAAALVLACSAAWAADDADLRVRAARETGATLGKAFDESPEWLEGDLREPEIEIIDARGWSDEELLALEEED